MTTTRRRHAWLTPWVLPWVLGFALFMLLPAALSLYYSFTDYPVLEKPIWVGGENYARMLGDERLHKAAWNTARYVAAIVPLSLVTALALAALLGTRRLKGERFFEAAIFLPTLLPLVASAMVWLWLFNGAFGLVNQALRPIWPAVRWLTGFVRGGEALTAPPNWLLDERFAMSAVVIVGVWGVGQATILLRAAMREVPDSLYEAAGLDGMGPWRRFWHVTLPMVSPVVLFNAVTMTIGAVQMFVVPHVLFQTNKGGPGETCYLYTMHLYDSAFSDGQMGYACALAWVQLVVVMALTGVMLLAGRKLVYYRS